MMLDYAKLYKNPNARVLIKFPSNGTSPSQMKSSSETLVALVESDFGFEMSSMFNDSDSVDPSGNINSVVTAGMNALGQAQRIVKSVQSTLSQWNGSTKPQFNLPITLITYSKSIDIVTQVQKLYSGVAPEI